MAWFTRFTRFGDMHWVCAQEQTMTCGLACVTMITFKIRKLTPGAGAIQTETEITNVYNKSTGTIYDPADGTAPEDLVKTLNALKLGVWKSESLSGPAVVDSILKNVGTTSIPGPTIRVNPMIVGIDWDEGGAHWVVIDTVRNFLGSQYATVCDPGDGDVHITAIESGKSFKYAPKKVFGSWDTRTLAGKAVGEKHAGTLDRVLGKKPDSYGNTPTPGESTNWGVIYRA